MKTKASIIMLGLGVLALFIWFIADRVNQDGKSSIPVLALTNLAEDVDYRLESFQTVMLSQGTYVNEAYMVIVSSDNLPVTSYNHWVAVVVAKQLVEICPADSNQPASARVTTVVSEGGQTRMLHLRPRYLRPDNEPRPLLAALPAGDK